MPYVGMVIDYLFHGTKLQYYGYDPMMDEVRKWELDMEHAIPATVQDGMLKLDVPIPLPSGTRVLVIVQDMRPGSQEAFDEFERLCDEVPFYSDGEKLTRDQLHERTLTPKEHAPANDSQQWDEELERLCQEAPIDSKGVRLTRDQLHERR